jgi:hypothetical protein
VSTGTELSASEYDERAMAQFASLPRAEQEAAIRRLAASGMGEQSIARASRLTVELVRRILARPGCEQ